MLTASAIGNLGNDPELRYSQAGAPVLRFNVATNGRVRNASGEWEDRTEWVRCTVFGQRAESLNEHLRKGMRVYVSGRLEARPWSGQDGSLRAGLELIADTIEFMSSRQDGEQSQGERGTAQAQQQYRDRRPPLESPDDDPDSDLPF